MEDALFGKDAPEMRARADELGDRIMDSSRAEDRLAHDTGKTWSEAAQAWHLGSSRLIPHGARLAKSRKLLIPFPIYNFGAEEAGQSYPLP